MLERGEDPLYIARRLVVVASEDVGLADPHGLPLVCPGFKNDILPFTNIDDYQAMATHQACQVIGMPECRLNLAVSSIVIGHYEKQ
jgi:putative ATPase